MKKPKFKTRYVLGEGYPWALGREPYTLICLVKKSPGADKIELNFPEELWLEDVPKYRLILEKVEE